MRYDAVLFDLDGTLMQSAEGIFAGIRYAASQLGFDVSQRDLRPYLGPVLKYSLLELLGSMELAEKALVIYRKWYLENGIHTCVPYPGVPEMLKTLHEAGITMATATCKTAQQAQIVISENHIEQYFSVAGGSYPERNIETKAQVIAEILKSPCFCGKRILMVGDRKDDMDGARACGLPAAAVRYGYAPEGELEREAPEFIADSCEQLTDWILKRN